MKTIAILGLLVGLLTAPGAEANLIAKGDLFVDFEGGISPRALPRERLAPITVTLSSTIATLSGQSPPALRRIEIELNRAGRLDTRGLPRCPESRVEATSTSTALAACEEALVGRGSFRTGTALPEQSAFPTNGRILAFNAEKDGRPAILAHVYGTQPVTATRLVFFYLRPANRLHGTILTGSLPAAVNRHGYLTHIGLRLHRTYRFEGERHSYLSASCAAPDGFPGSTFTFARAAMDFAGGGTLSGTVIRSCRVRG